MRARLCFIAIGLLLTACEPADTAVRQVSAEISAAYKKSGEKYVNFATLQGDKWTRVCFLGPYNTQSSQTLGFEWDVTQYTDVLESDSHNVVIFASESAVVAYAVHERNREDFWQLSGKCFQRQQSILFRDDEKGWRVGHLPGDTAP